MSSSNSSPSSSSSNNNNSINNNTNSSNNNNNNNNSNSSTNNQQQQQQQQQQQTPQSHPSNHNHPLHPHSFISNHHQFNNLSRWSNSPPSRSRLTTPIPSSSSSSSIHHQHQQIHQQQQHHHHQQQQPQQHLNSNSPLTIYRSTIHPPYPTSSLNHSSSSNISNNPPLITANNLSSNFPRSSPINHHSNPSIARTRQSASAWQRHLSSNSLDNNPNQPSSSSNPSSLNQVLYQPNQFHTHSLRSELLERPDSRSSLQSQLTAQPHQSKVSSNEGSAHQSYQSKNLQFWTEQWPRQWSWTGVDIPVHGVRALRDQIEPVNVALESGSNSLDVPSAEEDEELSLVDGADNSSSGEVVSCRFASDRWKVEVVKGHTRKASAPPTPNQPTSTFKSSTVDRQSSRNENLSLYLTCHELDVDWPTSRSISTSVLVSIKEPRIPISAHPITDLGSEREGWIWRVHCEEQRFERELEVWECHTFPSLSNLLENPRVAQYDSFILSIQVGTPAEVSIPQIPDASYVPHSLLEGLESLLDDVNTADVQILVTESDPTDCNKFRKRALYAHSNLLKSRSDYFHMMLSESGECGWAEGGNRLGNKEGRKLGLIKIEDFEFVSVYWLLHWLYTNRIFFSETEEVRSQFRLGTLLNSITYMFSRATKFSWEWQILKPRDSFDNIETSSSTDEAIDVFETVSESGINVVTNAIVSGTPRVAVASSTNSIRGRGKVLSSSATNTPKRRTTTNLSSSTSAYNSATNNNTAVGSVGLNRRGINNRVTRGTGFSELTQATNPRIGGSELEDLPVKDPDGLQDDLPLSWIPGEPHSHPITMNTKPSALAIYRLAHRYELKKLQELSMTYLIGNLTPATAFPLLLASFVFPDLHAEIKAYCLTNYYNILQEPEFSRCYGEVGEGLWEHGGEVLLSFTMSLMPGPELR